MSARGGNPFVGRSVPISGTPLEDHPTPAPGFMHEILSPLSVMLRAAGLRSDTIKAGCAKCGACSALSTYEAAGDPAQSAPLAEPQRPAWRPAIVDLVLEGARA